MSGVDTQTLRATLEVTSTDETSVVPFFTMVQETYESLDDKSDLAGFTDKLNERTDFPAERELFLRHVEDTDGMELVRYLAELGPDQIRSEWEAVAAERSAEPAGRDAFVADLQTYSGYWDRTEAGWPAFLTAFKDYAEGTHGQVAVDFFQRAETEDKPALFGEYGVTFADVPAEEEAPNRAEFVADLQTYSGYWDRTEAGWPAFLAAFEGYAEGSHGQVALDFFARAAGGEDKVALFNEFGVTFDDAGAPPAAEAAPDVDPLQSAAAQFSSLWAQFDGTRESWDQCRDATYRAANDQDPARYAVLYEQLQALEEQPMPQRVSQLNEWGFNLTATGEEDEDASYGAMAGMFDEEAVEASKQSLQEAVQASAAIDDGEAELIAEVFDEVIADSPEFGGVRLTKEQADHLMELIAQEDAA